MSEDNKGQATPDAPAEANGGKSLDINTKVDVKPAYQKPKRGFMSKLLNRGGVANQYIQDGDLLLKEKNIPHAINAYKTALAEDPYCTEALVGMAKCHEAMGGIKNAKIAVGYYYKALEEDFLQVDIYQAVVQMYLKLGDNKNAHNEKKKLQTVRTLKSNPNNPTANNNLGIIQLIQKQYDASIRSFQKAVKHEGYHSLGQLNLAKAWLQKAMHEKDPTEKKTFLIKSAKEVEAYLNNNKQADGLLLKAKIYMTYGDYQKALGYCNEAFVLDNTMKEILNTKRAIDEKLGNIQDASEAYDAYQSLAKEEIKMKSGKN